MRYVTCRRVLRRSLMTAAGVLALAVGLSLPVAAARADWHHHHGGTHVFLGFNFGPPAYYTPYPSYYYYPPAVYYPPPVYYVPPPAPPVVVQNAPSCTSGQWRQPDGSIVNGVACQQPDGSWRLQ
jgi:hypothetical protein